MSHKIKFKINTEFFSEFIDKLSDLTNIDDTIKLKIDNEHILIYSTLGGNVMLAFKNYLVNTKKYFDFENELEYSYDIILPNSKKFVKNLNFIKDSEKITMELTCKQSPEDDDVMNARSLQIVGGKLKVNWLGGERYEVKDINKTILKQRLDLKNRKWFFKLSNQEFSDVKKLSNINSDKIININVNSGKVILSENAAWELEVGNIEEDRNASLIFNKKFLGCINSDLSEIEFSMFETFILIKDQDTNLMLSYEQDFSDDDY
jgi:hypothetical protein